MNDREKKLIFILIGAAFIIANLFVYTSYDKALKQKKAELGKGANELKFKLAELEEASRRIDEVHWLNENMPAEGTHASIRAELVTSTEQSAAEHRIRMKKRPSPLPENPEEVGDFRSAIVKVLANSRDQELYRWLVELQDPKKARSITHLRITPQRDDATRIDCEMEITQWFTPLSEEDENAEEATTTNE